MPRSFRFFVKKRGTRSTGSGTSGLIALGGFFAALFLAGCWLFGSMMTSVVIPEWRVNQNFRSARCVVLRTRLAERGTIEKTYLPEILIQYEVGSGAAGPVAYQAWTYDISGRPSPDKKAQQALVDQFVVGNEYPCWYDPTKPTDVVLVRGHRWTYWLLLLVPVCFITVGGGGVFYVVFNAGPSVERKAALAQRAQRTVQLELFDSPASSRARDFPSVPHDAAQTESPGIKLAYRLPVSAASLKALYLTLISSLVWNGFAMLFWGIAVNSLVQGRPEWSLLLFLLPMTGVGGGLIYLFIRQLLRESSLGMTRVEISHHPLYPKGHYELFLSQDGRVKPDWLSVLLVCQEVAAYQQGTNTRIETCRVHEEKIHQQQGFEALNGGPLELHCGFSIPAGAMHSFKSGHNGIHWKLLIRQKRGKEPELERAYTIVVYPADKGGNGDG